MSGHEPETRDAASIARTKGALDESVDALDGATLSRLNRARQAALDSSRPRAFRPAFLGAGAAAALSAVLVLALTLHPGDPARVSTAGADAAADFEMLSSQDTLDLVEDQEFYAWLDAQSPSSG